MDEVEKLDLYGHKDGYLNWKKIALESGVDELTKINSDLLIRYLSDMETGNNVAKVSKKGARSYIQLNKLKQRVSWMMEQLQQRGVKDITKVKSEQLTRLLTDMEKGIIKTRLDGAYRSADSYASCFKAFWHWWQKVNRKEGKHAIPDITEDLSTKPPERKFVYFTKEQLDKMLPYFNEDEQVMLLFMFDSLVRFPTELASLKVKDIFEKEGEVWVNVPQAISKVIGRQLNLVFCGKAIQEYIRRKNLESDNRLFDFSPEYTNRKIKKVAVQVFGDVISHPKAGEKFSQICGYDFRHSGTAHFRILAQNNPGEISLDALRHRGGWSDFDMLNYYTKLIGLDGKIDKNGLLIKQDKHKLEQEIETLKKQIADQAQRFENLAKMVERDYDVADKTGFQIIIPSEFEAEYRPQIEKATSQLKKTFSGKKFEEIKAIRTRRIQEEQ